MSLWWLLAGAIFLAYGAVFTAMAEDWVMTKAENEDDILLRTSKIGTLRKRAAYINCFGALIVVLGSILSISENGFEKSLAVVVTFLAFSALRIISHKHGQAIYKSRKKEEDKLS